MYRRWCKQCCGAGVGRREAKINCLPKPKLRIAAPAPFYLPQTLGNFIRKNPGCWRSFVKLWSRGWSQNSDLRLRGAEPKEIFSTPQHRMQDRCTKNTSYLAWFCTVNFVPCFRSWSRQCIRQVQAIQKDLHENWILSGAYRGSSLPLMPGWAYFMVLQEKHKL